MIAAGGGEKDESLCLGDGVSSCCFIVMAACTNSCTRFCKQDEDWLVYTSRGDQEVKVYREGCELVCFVGVGG